MGDNVIRELDSQTLKECFVAAATLLDAKKQALNDLNVFPVPDGDTGTNMSLTMKSVMKELSQLTENSVSAVANAASRGALKGARGNSGVILSQLLRGFAMPLEKAEKVDAMLFAAALRQGVEMAYKAVLKPREGTILTVARVMAEETYNAARKGATLADAMNVTVESGKAILAKTPDMLPVLKKAGVVDAGGQGWLFICNAFCQVVHGEYLPETAESLTTESFGGAQAAREFQMDDDLENITFAYCTEFFVENLLPTVTERDIAKLRDYLSGIGDSIVVVGDLSLIKVHVHTNDPGKALQNALKLGELNGLKIENMLMQHREVMKAREAEEKLVGVAAVAAGEGLAEILKDIGVDRVISGGQTMNPSTEDILNEVKQIRARQIIILPNNSNIIMSAQQVKSLIDKPVYVVPTKTVPQGISAMLAFNPEAGAAENGAVMEEAMKQVKTGSLTYAVRDTEIDGLAIKQNDVIGLFEGKIVASGKEIEDTALALARSMFDGDDVITVYYGEGVTEIEARALHDRIVEMAPDSDVELHSGGQPVYYYIISME